MPFEAACCCQFHSEWGFGDPARSSIELKSANVDQKRFCGINKDKKHNDRKRKICVACANKIDSEVSSSKRVEVEVSCSCLFLFYVLIRRNRSDTRSGLIYGPCAKYA